MNAPIVLVAYSSQSGSTAGIAEVIAFELRAAGIAADCRVAAEVGAIEPYDAIVLGSGVFLRHRQSDGGGFLARNRDALATRALWLFCAGPIGRGTSIDADASGECAVVEVGRAIGARGAAAFGCQDAVRTLEDLDRLPPMDVARVRGWARDIATDLGASRGSLAPTA
jgi:menaquinone-dependent protoporphyrinogen oxidase